MALEQYYETDLDVLALCAKDAEVLKEHGIQTVDANVLMQKLTLNVHVGIGATSPRMQLANFVYAMEKSKEIFSDGVMQQLGLKPQEALSEIFGKLGYKTADRFFEFGESEDPQVAMLKQQLDEANQKLGQKEDPELVAAKVKKTLAEVDQIAASTKDSDAKKVLTTVEASYAAMQAAQSIALMPAIAPIADEVMKAAGYVPPTPPGIDPNFPQPAVPSAGQPAGNAMPPDALRAQKPPQPNPEVAAQVLAANGGQPPKKNTSPLFPPKSGKPGSGMTGIEKQGAQGDLTPDELQANDSMQFAAEERRKLADHQRAKDMETHKASLAEKQAAADVAAKEKNDAKKSSN